MANTMITTVGGKSGPAITATSVSLPNATLVDFEVSRGVGRVFYGNNAQYIFDYNQTTTVTMTISGTVTTLTIA